MHAIVQDNNITEIITRPKSIVIGDVRYPAKIFQLWSKAEKEAIGVYEVVTDSTNFKDPEYYINTNSSYTFADGQVTESWGTATAKQLEDSLWTQQDSDDGLMPDDKSVGEVKIQGLKNIKIEDIKKQASNLLSPTDWYVIKATEVADYSVPSNVTTFRTNVRAKSNEMETSINGASDVDALQALFTYTQQDDDTIARPLGEFPRLEN
tara:strand:+ start:470 stop:1093 length:624 start_codon:yes stop_codon:yes gene_type:complete